MGEPVLISISLSISLPLDFRLVGYTFWVQESYVGFFLCVCVCLFLFIFYLNFLFYIGIEPMNNVIVSGEQGRDSAIYIRVSILPLTPLPSRLPHNIEQSSLCYTVGPWLST